MKVCIVGDTHGDDTFISRLHKMIELDRKRYTDPNDGVNTIIQLGDFSLFYNKNIIHSISSWLNKNESYRWYWIDGNHDNHDYIDQVILDNEFTKDVPIAHYHERMFYCPRGSVTTIGKTKCMFVGGGVSIDKSERRYGVSWFPQETISYSDINRALDNNKDIKIMFTHDAPITTVLEKTLQTLALKTEDESYRHRMIISQLVDEIHPTVLFHGHYHYRYSALYSSPDGKKTVVQGLDCNVDSRLRRKLPIWDENYIFLEL